MSCIRQGDDEACGELSLDQLLSFHRAMLLIRAMEERLGELVAAGEVPGAVHLSIGQEAVAVGVCAHLSDDDWIASTHRGHGHFLAKGGSPSAMASEVLGRASGSCGGKGGSMHVADIERGMLGANGIVGGGIGIAVGAAWSMQLAGNDRVAVAFFGDGGANQGVVAEALNLAALWKLPLLLVCENNGYSEFSRSDAVTAGGIAERAHPFGVPSVRIDGNDVVQVWRAAREAVGRSRRGEGPTFIEALTYRHRGHVETEKSFLSRAYRTDDEVEQWQARDPIPRFAAQLAERGVERAKLAELAESVDAEVARVWIDAIARPEPDRRAAFSQMID
ncbi:MAG: thiamine pyrophosphate-dependent dehydrogenase E1 component subunit alpha [Burkholderiaceae bacterium]|nr:thiamine pyrophosphate-dependent dehydrogenase E1 component subunit alpha [Burkholderiaceae bacterium]